MADAHDHDHGHGHGHGDHGHGHGDHGHGHGGHGHGDHGEGGAGRALTRPDLPAGAGRGKLLHLDLPSGIAGDMTVAALLDLGVPLFVVESAVEALALPEASVSVAAVFRGAISATAFSVHCEASGHDRTLADILDILRTSKLAPGVSELAQRIFLRLGHAEAKVHHIELMDVTFHEVGAVDAIVDVVGAAACLEHLGASVSATPVPLGKGFVECRHGVLPLPAPAALECLVGVPTYDSGLDVELVTPTGAAILSTVASSYCRLPAMVPEVIGWGAGSQRLADRPNAVRAILGTPTATATSTDSHAVLEANLDDASGEILGHAVDKLLAAGALDAWVTPVTMKKGRPGWVLSALSPAALVTSLGELVLRETPSIGVRFTHFQRLERPRRVVQVQTQWGEVPVKVSEGPYGPAQIKPEFDVCRKLAAEAGVPVRVIVQAALLLLRDQDQ
ncbi:MAG: nickel pincer cofactor biosynthesis protein LarC [Polyangiaceae bacterium]